MSRWRVWREENPQAQPQVPWWQQPPSPEIQQQAAAELEKRKRRRKNERLVEFVHDVTPRWAPPTHLEPLCELFDRAQHEPVFALVSVPPQHGKTETVLHGCAQHLLRFPERTIGYASYAADFAHSKSKLARAYAQASGVVLDENANTAHEWLTREGGGFLATGVGGQITGRPVSGIFVIDDPHKNRAEAESLVYRDKVYDLFSSVALTRIHPTTSIIILHTRWHEDDLIGRLSQLRKSDFGFRWEVINLPAINDGSDPRRLLGEALWPSHRPGPFFERVRAAGLTDYDWESMYMGRPRPKGGAVFHGVTYYDELPKKYRIGKGSDFAYTENTRADHSVGVALLEHEEMYYVVDVQRKQAELDAFVPYMRKQTAVFPGRYRFYSSTTEKGLAQLSKLLKPEDIRIHAIRAAADKFTRAQPAATFWNRQKIAIPSAKACEQLRAMGLDPSWVDDFKKEVERFTGVSDRQDDQIDALAAAFDEIPRRKGEQSSGSIQTYESPMAGW